ncbi:CPBP family intramembrane glutamic endopeptidase [Natronobacterium gregoryi]|uniref:Abortive infection protein n=2 Tax=Natronobacterium gregoryi TaxID=44930 RepID=L0AFN2_NATGS|nr:type II CAAX endopeptidase family protein [Natronobacterium gregoryi]AFZ72244.1 putative metal-dependent membrane protease [Natronobacterium gregoryi SP2]ELY62356.1 Abortive infection protein [Natronobacterium gregoryi SP2]PLK20191.1 CPBP family intramembrane metalloprotease [Natronobacterium gregoryi SP2]SFJ28817.1 hypothetical protein SAMN05443661_12042 [Natronobacterium gregoryi]
MTDTVRADDTGATDSDVASSLGTAVAAVTMAAVLVPVRRGVDEPAVLAASGFALVAVFAFLARRHGGPDRRPVAVVATLSSLAVVLLSGYALNRGLLAVVDLPVPLLDGTWSLSLLVTAFVTAGLCVGLGAADYFGVGVAGLVRRAQQTATLAGVGIVGLYVPAMVTLVLEGPAAQILSTPELSMVQGTVVSQLGMALGTGLVVFGYITLRQYDLSFIDLHVPTKRDAAWAVGGLVVLFGAMFLISFFFELIGVESAEHGTTGQAQQSPEVLLVLIPAAILVVGPFEELLYRNVIQKELYRSFSRYGAIVVASVIFALVHVFAYGTADLGAVIASLGIVFGLSIVLGAIYERTDNLLIPSLVHGVYNALLWTSLYFTYA